MHSEENTSFVIFFKNAFSTINFLDLWTAVAKAVVFGFTIGIIGCYKGFNATQGTSGVGKAANEAVVMSMFIIFVKRSSSYKFLTGSELLNDNGNTHVIDYNETVISIKDLYKSFGDLHVLKGVSLDLHKGENIVVLGKSGTGKSVLIKIISGLLKPDKGEVIVLGKKVNELKRKELNELRLHIGFSFQNSALYDSMNVRRNLEFPLMMNYPKLTKKEVDAAVEEVMKLSVKKQIKRNAGQSFRWTT